MRQWTPWIRAAVPGVSVDELDDMQYVDWLVYQRIAAMWRATHGGG